MKNTFIVLLCAVIAILSALLLFGTYGREHRNRVTPKQVANLLGAELGSLTFPKKLMDCRILLFYQGHQQEPVEFASILLNRKKEGETELKEADVILRRHPDDRSMLQLFLKTPNATYIFTPRSLHLSEKFSGRLLDSPLPVTDPDEKNGEDGNKSGTAAETAEKTAKTETAEENEENKSFIAPTLGSRKICFALFSDSATNRRAKTSSSESSDESELLPPPRRGELYLLYEILPLSGTEPEDTTSGQAEQNTSSDAETVDAAPVPMTEQEKGETAAAPDTGSPAAERTGNPAETMEKTENR